MKVDKILCMRALDAPLVADGTRYDSRCGTCGMNVCVAPTSLPVIAANPGIEIVCNECYVAQADDEIYAAPGAMEETRRTIEDAKR